MTAGSQPVPVGHPPRRVSVYIDEFNFYYGSLNGTPYKWLDPYALACALMPADHVTAVHYFTARVKPTPRNPLGPPASGHLLEPDGDPQRRGDCVTRPRPQT